MNTYKCIMCLDKRGEGAWLGGFALPRRSAHRRIPGGMLKRVAVTRVSVGLIKRERPRVFSDARPRRAAHSAPCWAGWSDASSRHPCALTVWHDSLHRARALRRAGCSAPDDEAALTMVAVSLQGAAQLCPEWATSVACATCSECTTRMQA